MTNSLEAKPMHMMFKIAAMALLMLPARSFAGEKKPAPPRTLTEDAAFLTQKSGKAGWASDDLLLAREDGKTKFRGRLTIIVYADKDKARIFGLNAAKIYGVDVHAKRNALPADAFSKLKQAYIGNGGLRDNAAYGWVRSDA